MMKTYIFLCLIFFSLHALSQPRFVRLYDAHHHKIGRGKIVAVNDTTVRIFDSSIGMQNIPIIKIDHVLTLHSGGHNIGICVLVSGVAGMVLGGATANPDEFLGYTQAEGVGIGLVFGAFIGSIAGGISALVKGIERIEIHGDKNKMRELMVG